MAEREEQKVKWTLEFVAAAAIFALALLARLLFLFSSSDRAWPHSVWYEGDAPTWVRWARALSAGEPFEFDLPLRTPGVAYLLHWLGAGEATSFVAMKMLWCAMSAAACAVAYLGFREVFNRRASLIAAVMCAFSFGLYVTATSLNNETPYMLVLFTSAWLTLRVARSPAWWLVIVLAALHGTAMLLRAEHALALVIMAAYVVWAMKPTCRSGWALGAVIVLGAIVVCLPWSVRGAMAIHRFNHHYEPLPEYESAQPPWTADARASLDSLPAFARDGNFRFITHIAQVEGKPEVTRGDVERFFTERFERGGVPRPLSRFVLVSMKGPLDFALANHPAPLRDGGFSRTALGGDDVELAFANPDHLKLINHGYAIGLRWIADDVPGWLALVGSKLRNFADGVAMGFTARNLPLGVDGVRRPVDVVVPGRSGGVSILWRIAVFSLIVAGAVMAGRKGGIWLLIIAYKVAVTILFYGYARQAVSILPAFFIFGALTIDWLLAQSMSRLNLRAMHGWIIAGAILALLVLIEVHAAINPASIEVRGRIDAAPQWGEGAFESFHHIELIASPR